MYRFFVPLVAIGAFTSAAAADELKRASEAVVACRDLQGAEKAECFDRSSLRLSEVLKQSHGEPEHNDTAPDWAKAPEPAPTAVAGNKSKNTQKPETPKQFTVTVVRVGSAGGKMKFYTDDGQVWKQTQRDAVTLPPLPSTAKIKRRLTGNPVIQFPNRSKSYKVERVE